MKEKLEDIRDRLQDIAEELSDLGITALHEALEADGVEAKRPEIEKRLSRARRAVEKAASIVGDKPQSTTI